MGWFNKKTSWDDTYAQRIYEALAASDDLGETPERLNIPLTSYRRYADKALSQREIFCLVALILAASPTIRPMLQPVLIAFTRLLDTKFKQRGISTDMDRFAEQSIQDVNQLLNEPLKWSQHWLAEFRDDPNDSYMVYFFADHSSRQFQAIKSGIEKTYKG